MRRVRASYLPPNALILFNIRYIINLICCLCKIGMSPRCRRGGYSGARQSVTIKYRFALDYVDLDGLVDQFVAVQLIQQHGEKLPLHGWCDLRHEDHQASMKLHVGIQSPEIGRVVRDEAKVAIENARHQVPIGGSTKAEPDDVRRLVAAVCSDRDQRGVQAFVDEKAHGCRLQAAWSFTRLLDFNGRPRSPSDFGRPRRGCAAVQIRESSR